MLIFDLINRVIFKVQRSTAQKEKDQIKKTKQQVYGDQPYLRK